MLKKIVGIFTLCTCLFIVSSTLKAAEVPYDSEKGQNRLNAVNQRKFDYFYYEALNLKNAEKFDAAFDAFNHCLAIYPTSAPLLYELSSFYLQLNRPEKAVQFLKQAVENSSDNFSYKIALANVTRGLGMYREAIQEFEKLIKQYPEKVELNYHLAEALTQQGEIPQAIEAFNALEASMGMNEALSMQKCRLYNSIGESENAMKEIQRLAEKFPIESRYQIILGDLYLENNETDKALEAYEKAKAIEPGSPYYIVAMANYYEVTGDKESAETQIHNALINEKLDVETKVSILSRYILTLQQSNKDIESANQLFETLLEQHPEESELKLMYGSLLSMQEKNEEARFQFQLITEMEPENMAAWQQLLQLSLRTEDLEEVIRVCKKCIELFPDAPEYYFYLGIAYHQLEDYPQAIQAYQDGINNTPRENGPLLSDFYGQIGDVYYQSEQMDKAFEAYEEALKQNEGNVMVLNNYAYFLTLAKKDLKKAERMSEQTVRKEPNNSTYLDTYAWVYFTQGNYTLAKIYIERAIDNDKTNNAELLDHYGDILYMLGETEKAVEQWKKAKELGKEGDILDRKIAEEKYIEDVNAK
ncbi:MAG: tetratricopeptide repeat protein [Tannerellaceae bacterium]|nr:tetratricopeptide repeat protein [Tannerellaceae bacterium]